MGLLSFIPRLVVHKDEIQRIFFPDSGIVVVGEDDVDEIGTTTTTGLEEDDFQLDFETHARPQETMNDSDVADVDPPTWTGGFGAKDLERPTYDAVSDAGHHNGDCSTQPKLVPDNAMLDRALASLEHIRSESLFWKVVGRLVTLFVLWFDAAMRIWEMVVATTRTFVHTIIELPHKALHVWREIAWVLVLLVSGTVLASSLVFFIQLAPVDEGLSKNRGFLYGTLTYYELLVLLPMVETSSFANPRPGDLPVSAKVLTIVLGISLQKTFDWFVGEAVWSWNQPMQVFPIPFAVVVSGAVSFFTIVPMLSFATPRNARRSIRFDLLFRLLCVYWTSLLVVSLWAVGMRRLTNYGGLQNALGLLYGPLRFVCKIMVAAPLTTALNPRRWIMLNLVVDILFTRVQISTFPFIGGLAPFLSLFVSEVGALLWRYYGGIDRLALWFGVVVGRIAARGSNEEQDRECDAPQEPSLVELEFGDSIRHITTGCFGASIPRISRLNLGMKNCGDAQSVRSAETESPKPLDPSSEGPEDCCSLPSSEYDEHSACCDSPGDVNELKEELWEQRPFYHIIDSVGSTTTSIIVRLNQLLSIAIVRNVSSSENLNATFHLDDESWKRSQMYSWAYLCLMVFLLASLESLFFSRMEKLRPGHSLTLSRVVSYIYRDHFWFFFLWLSATGGYMASTMIKHFGADFTLRFNWLGCPQGFMVWPDCFPERMQSDDMI